MARSHYIYVVCDEDVLEDMPIMAAFTVKHELFSWLRRCVHPNKSKWKIYRIVDNDIQFPCIRAECTEIDLTLYKMSSH